MKSIRNEIPLFKKGKVLNSKNLNLLRDFPMEMLEIRYQEYSSGILHGLSLRVEDGEIVVERGVVKWKDLYYKVDERIKLSIPQEEGSYIIKLRFHPQVEEEGNLVNEFHLILDGENQEISEDEMELGRFKRRNGAALRDRSDFIGIAKEYNVIDNTRVINSSNSDGGVLNDKLLVTFGRELLRKRGIRSIDESFALLCLNGDVKRITVIEYINIKLRSEREDYSVREMYEALAKVINIKAIEETNERKISKTSGIRKKILID